jgi:hypothetical protein
VIVTILHARAHVVFASVNLVALNVLVAVISVHGAFHQRTRGSAAGGSHCCAHRAHG